MGADDADRARRRAAERTQRQAASVCRRRVAVAARVAPALLERTFPVVSQFPKYPQRSLKRDAVAEVTVAALALPSAMAYAQTAGLSPVAGLYGLLLAAGEPARATALAAMLALLSGGFCTRS